MKSQLNRKLSASFTQNRDVIALISEETKCTYKELDEKSKSVAAWLSKHKENEEFIGVIAHKTLQTYASILGVLRSGKAYLPLHPKFPGKKIESILRLSGIKTILLPDDYPNTEVTFTPQQPLEVVRVIPNLSHEFQESEISESNPAYLLFTSGTTGQAKGVAICHSQLNSYLEQMSKLSPLKEGNRCSQTFELNFDLSVHDIFHTLLHGATLCIPSESDLISPARYILNHQITHFFCVPSVIKVMDKLRQLKPENFYSVKKILLCGEAFPTLLAKKILDAAPGAKILNLYGPTEATIAVSHYELEENPKENNGIISIGKVFDNNEFQLLPHPENALSKELLLKGKQVITKYFTPAEDDSKQFFTDEIGARWYRTGDLVTSDDNGNLFFVSRTDEQIKLNGLRIEPAEIEQVALRLSKANAAVCLLIKAGNSDRLCLALETEYKIEINEFREQLKTELASYLLPQQIVSLPSFPTNANGKTDKKALTEMIAKSYG